MKPFESFDPYEEERHKRNLASYVLTQASPIGGRPRGTFQEVGSSCDDDPDGAEFRGWEIVRPQGSAVLKSFLARAKEIIACVVLSSEQAEMLSKDISSSKGSYPSISGIGHLPPVLVLDESETGSDLSAMQDVHDLGGEFKEMFRSGHELEIEDGVENQLSTRLVALVLKYQRKALECLREELGAPQNDPRLQAEALKRLGKMKDPSLRQGIREILQEALCSKVDQIRMGAAFGLASLDDPSLRDSIRRARVEEANSYIAIILDKVLGQIERTSGGSSSQET